MLLGLTCGLLSCGERQDVSQHDQPFSERRGPEELHLALGSCGDGAYEPPQPGGPIGTVLWGRLYWWRWATHVLRDQKLQRAKGKGRGGGERVQKSEMTSQSYLALTLTRAKVGSASSQQLACL